MLALLSQKGTIHMLYSLAILHLIESIAALVEHV